MARRPSRPPRRPRAPTPRDRRIAAKVPHIPEDELAILRDRLARLGLRGLGEYMKTEQWSDVWTRFKASPFEKACMVCGSRNYQLHHRTYQRLGRERLPDLAPLCHEHHEAAHELIARREPGVTLWNAHLVLRDMSRTGAGEGDKAA